MNKTEFLLRLKLQKGIGYQRLLQAASLISGMEQIEDLLLGQNQVDYTLQKAWNNAFVNEELAKASQRIQQQCQVISFFDDLFPQQLREIYQPPLLLFLQGDASLLGKTIVTVVGAREASQYSASAIQAFFPSLAKQNVVIASGLAKGVDALAHLEALKLGMKTIAVVGNGLNHFYPSANHALQGQIAINGLLVSEYLPDTRPKPFRFPERNRILAGLCRDCIVVEAKEHSGSLITARLALEENRNVLAVPGPITSSLSAGPNRLINDGATPILLESTFAN